MSQVGCYGNESSIFLESVKVQVVPAIQSGKIYWGPFEVVTSTWKSLSRQMVEAALARSHANESYLESIRLYLS